MSQFRVTSGELPAGEHPNTGERFRFAIPTGHVMEPYAEKGYIGNGCGIEGQHQP